MEEIKKAVSWLKSIRNDDGGWGNIEFAPTTITNTGEAVFGILVSGDKDAEFSKKSLEFLNSAIIQGWCNKTRHYCWATIGLLSTGVISLNFKDAILRAMDWLLKYQRKEGGWGHREDDLSKVYPTSLSLRTLKAIENSGIITEKQKNQINNAIRNGIIWLLSVQKEDGGWGFDENEESNPATTAHSIIALCECKTEEQQALIEKAIERGKKWFERHPPENNGWDIIEEPERVGDERFLFQHFTTPWAIIALLKIGLKITDRVIQNAIKCLLTLQDQTNGGWKPSKNMRPHVWATSNAILALITTKEHFHPIEEINPLINEIKKIREEKDEVKAILRRNAKEIIILNKKFKFISSKSFLKFLWFISIFFSGIMLLFLSYLISGALYTLSMGVILIMLGIVSTICVRKIWNLSWPTAIGLVFTIVGVAFAIISAISGSK